MQIPRSLKLVALNMLTISRIPLILIGFLWPLDLYFFVISIWAAISDFLDGFLARRLDLVSSLGEQLDQISDKVFHFGMFLFLLNAHLIHLYFVILFLLREIVIIGLRHFNASRKSSNFYGKLKTFLSYSFIVCMLAQKIFLADEIFTNVGVVVFESAILAVSYYSLMISIRTSQV